MLKENAVKYNQTADNEAIRLNFTWCCSFTWA